MQQKKKNLSKKILKVKCHYQGLPQISYLLNEILIFNIRKAFRTNAMMLWLYGYISHLYFLYIWHFRQSKMLFKHSILVYLIDYFFFLKICCQINKLKIRINFITQEYDAWEYEYTRYKISLDDFGQKNI